MSIVNLWLWEIYFILALGFAAIKAYYLFTPSTSEHLYYYILRTFDPELFMVYNAHVLYVLLNALHCLPLWLFIHRVRLFNPEIWKFLFVARVLFEIVGQNYQINAVTAMFYADPKLLLLLLAMMAFPQIPSYAACYLYAFRQEKILA